MVAQTTCKPPAQPAFRIGDERLVKFTASVAQKVIPERANIEQAKDLIEPGLRSTL